MFRRIATTLTLVVMGLLTVPALASAGPPPYQAPPVETTSTLAPVANTSASTTSNLASTGAGFSVGTAVAIGIAVLLVGLVLAFAGNRVRKTNA